SILIHPAPYREWRRVAFEWREMVGFDAVFQPYCATRHWVGRWRCSRGLAAAHLDSTCEAR
ncbi:MAG TPA: hypothetical protein VFC57_01115, partial [Aeromicrobium sp.]|nr:hypothetical protein [Aeromicrobium sp.]